MEKYKGPQIEGFRKYQKIQANTLSSTNISMYMSRKKGF